MAIFEGMLVRQLDMQVIQTKTVDTDYDTLARKNYWSQIQDNSLAFDLWHTFTIDEFLLLFCDTYNMCILVNVLYPLPLPPFHSRWK